MYILACILYIISITSLYDIIYVSTKKKKKTKPKLFTIYKCSRYRRILSKFGLYTSIEINLAICSTFFLLPFTQVLDIIFRIHLRRAIYPTLGPSCLYSRVYITGISLQMLTNYNIVFIRKQLSYTPVDNGICSATRYGSSRVHCNTHIILQTSRRQTLRNTFNYDYIQRSANTTRL